MPNVLGNPPPLPDRVAALRDRQFVPITVGKSDATVWRIEGHGDALFLKASPIHPLSETPGEAARLAWLAETSIPAPRLLDTFEADGLHWLLMTALPGTDLTHLVDRPAELCRALAGGLRALHSLDVSSCPFDQRLDAKLAVGAAYADAGLVDETDFGEAHDGWTAQEVLAWLRAHRTPAEDLVVAHGDASLPNLLAHKGSFSGIIDCGRIGVADRWQDLAIACRSIIFNCGKDHIAPFLAAYGAEWDGERFAYYNALDELF